MFVVEQMTRLYVHTFTNSSSTLQLLMATLAIKNKFCSKVQVLFLFQIHSFRIYSFASWLLLFSRKGRKQIARSDLSFSFIPWVFLAKHLSFPPNIISANFITLDQIQQTRRGWLQWFTNLFSNPYYQLPLFCAATRARYFRRIWKKMTEKTSAAPRKDFGEMTWLKRMQLMVIENICRVVIMIVKTIGPNSLIV